MAIVSVLGERKRLRSGEHPKVPSALRATIPSAHLNPPVADTIGAPRRTTPIVPIIDGSTANQNPKCFRGAEWDRTVGLLNAIEACGGRMWTWSRSGSRWRGRSGRAWRDAEGRAAAKRADDGRADISAVAAGAGTHWAGGSGSGGRAGRRSGAQARHLPGVSPRRAAGAELAHAPAHIRHARGTLRGEPMAPASVARPHDHHHDHALRTPVEEQHRPIPEGILAAGNAVVDPDARIVAMLGARSDFARGTAWQRNSTPSREPNETDHLTCRRDPLPLKRVTSCRSVRV